MPNAISPDILAKLKAAGQYGTVTGDDGTVYTSTGQEQNNEGGISYTPLGYTSYAPGQTYNKAGATRAEYGLDGGFAQMGRNESPSMKDIAVPLLAATAMMGLPGGALADMFSGGAAASSADMGMGSWGAGTGGTLNAANDFGLASTVGGAGGASTLTSIAPFTDSLAGTSLVQPSIGAQAGSAAAAGAGGGLSTLLNGAGGTVAKLATSVIPAILGGGGGGSGGGSGGTDPSIDGGSLAKIIQGYLDNQKQGAASDNMLNYLKQRQAYNDNMYSAGSPELAAMQQEMDRKDAAAGRNSQYGPRAVDLAGRIAQLKMNANTSLTGNVARYMQTAYNQKASAPAGLSAAISGLFGGKLSPADLQTIISKITGGGDPNATDAVSTGPDNSRSYDPNATTNVDGSVNNALNNIPGYDPNLPWD